MPTACQALGRAQTPYSRQRGTPRRSKHHPGQTKRHGDLAAGLLRVGPLTWKHFPAAGPHGGLWETHGLSRQNQREGRGSSGSKSDGYVCGQGCSTQQGPESAFGCGQPCCALSLGVRSAAFSAAKTFGVISPGEQRPLCTVTELAVFAGTLGEGNGTTLQYSCLENPMDGGAW